MEEQDDCKCCEEAVEAKIPQHNVYVEKFVIESVDVIKIENGFLLKVEAKQYKNMGKDYDWETKQHYVANLDQVKDKLVEIYK